MTVLFTWIFIIINCDSVMHFFYHLRPQKAWTLFHSQLNFIKRNQNLNRKIFFCIKVFFFGENLCKTTSEENRNMLVISSNSVSFLFFLRNCEFSKYVTNYQLIVMEMNSEWTFIFHFIQFTRKLERQFKIMDAVKLFGNIM